MRTVHKYILREADNDVPTYEGVKFLHVDNQYDTITVWAEVDTTAQQCVKRLSVVGTGHPIPDSSDHIGSVLGDGGRFVFHVYEQTA